MITDRSFGTTIGQVLSHLQRHESPLLLSRRQLTWDDIEFHQAAYTNNPRIYSLLALAPNAQSWQRARILLQMLRTSQRGLDNETKALLERITRILLLALPADQTLTVLLALRRLRANHKHTTRAILQFIMEHPQADLLSKTRRPALRDSYEHALGKSSARTCVQLLATPALDREEYLQRHLLRFGHKPTTVAERLNALYGPGEPTSSAPSLLSVPVLSLENGQERPQTVTTTNRGDIAATLVHLYRGGTAPELEQALNNYIDEFVRQIPQFSGKIAVVFDASASTRSYGDREFACLAQSVALRLVLERCCANLTVTTVGGSGRIPQPEGATDLAEALLDALDHASEVVAIISDGYENQYPGDLARVVATLPQIGVHIPVLFCHSAFTNSDDLSLRRPVTHLPERKFWHQEDFIPLMIWMFSHASAATSEAWLHSLLLIRLVEVESEVQEQAQ